MFIRGDRTVNLSNPSEITDVTLSATGSLHTGNFDVQTSNFANNFSFIGNPYQAVVDLTQLTYGDGVNNNFAYYWEPTKGNAGGFVTIALQEGIPAPDISNANQFLRPGQAVFMRNNSTGLNYGIRFEESDKNTSVVQNQVFSANQTVAFLNVRMYKTASYNSNLREEDAFGLRFSNQGNNEIDELDAVKLGNMGINLAVVNGSRILSIETRNLPQDGETLPLFYNNLATENYTFRFQMGNLPNNIKVFLNDAYLNTSTEITENFQVYSFDVDMAIDASKASQRFSILFEEIILSVNENELTNKVTMYPNPASDFIFLNHNHIEDTILTIEITNSIGQQFDVKYSEQQDDQTIRAEVSQLPVGLYFMTVKCKDGTVYQNQFVKN